ncbi:MAG: cell division protein FtsZ [Candidatus Woesearchaeota archaeon]
MAPTYNNIDEELLKYVENQKTRIKIIGVGGAGNNTVERIYREGIEGAQIIAVNTDAQDLLYTPAHKKILIGKELTRGLGAGSDPKIGEEAAKESLGEIRTTLENTDLVFITCGLGGGTGTGAAPVIAEVAKKIGALVISVVTLPFSMEGAVRRENAMQGLMKLEKNSDTVIVIPNDKLLELIPNVSINLAFKIADEILTNAVKGISEMITKAGLINVDFADVRTVMKEGGVALIGLGESDTEKRAEEAVEKALNNPLLDVDISNGKAALINVMGGEDLTLDEAKKVVDAVASQLNPEALIIWGAYISKDLGKNLKVLLIVTGVKSRQIFGKGRPYRELDEEDLGIDFID